MLSQKISTNRLEDLIESHTAKIGIIGLGYVGLPLALAFTEENFKVVGFDIDESKTSNIRKGISYIQHIGRDRVKEATSNGLLEATTDFSRITEIDAIIICVPTPIGKHNEPNMKFIEGTIAQIKPYLRAGQILSLESTTYPGTTNELIAPSIKEMGLTIGSDFFLVYSPEREDPGNTEFNTQKIPKVLGGYTSSCTKIGHCLYSRVIKEVVTVSNTMTAEFTKLLENIYRAVNIGLMNELKPLAHKMDIDLYEVIRAAATKPFGFTPFYPGPGLGGHCIPIDPFYLTWKAKEYGINTKFIELAGEINSSMPEYVLNRTSEALNQHGKSLKNSRILILGISYKKNIDDSRESPSKEIIRLLLDRGAQVNYSDPFFKDFPKSRSISLPMKSVGINKKTISEHDIIILATDHDDFDYDLIEKYGKIIVDTRGKFTSSEKIHRA